MRNRTWSDVVMSLLIALCVTLVAEPQGERSAPAAAAPNIAESAQSLAAAVLFSSDGSRIEADRLDVDRRQEPSSRSATEHAMANAAEAAGNAARDIEMPFFSFGGDASVE